MNKLLIGKHWYLTLLAFFLIAVVITMVITAFEFNIVSKFLIKWAGQWATALGAIFAVLIVFVAFLSIRNSNEQAEKHRYQEAAKETRDRKERILDEIIKWANDILKCGRLRSDTYEMRIAKAKGKMAIRNLLIREVEAGLIVPAVNNIYLRHIVTMFKPALQSAVEKAIVRMTQHSNVLDLVKNNKAKHESIGIHRKRLDAAAKLVVKEAVEEIKMLSSIL